MRVFDCATQEIKQGGKRRGANMGILNYNHPDILDFITCKSRGGFTNFNISVAVDNAFMRAVERGKKISLINPRTKKVTQEISAQAIWDLIITEAWKTGDPGLLFLDTVNRSYSNCVPKYGRITACNPCGEEFLYPYESCNLGSINVSKLVKENKKTTFDWERFREIIHLAVHFLDNVIDANKYPLPEIDKISRNLRRIGLGIMGFADLLTKLEIPYNSQQALDFAEKLASFLTKEARKASVELGKERGNFPDFKDSIWVKKGFKYLRNSGVTCIAPTGTISILAGCSTGIEPLFAIVTVRNLQESLGAKLVDINQEFLKKALERGFYSEELIEKISKQWSIQDVEEIPKDIRRVFVTAHDIPPDFHVKMQVAFQKHIDNSISKTVNLPYFSTPHDIDRIYKLAWKLGAKGITVFRTGCRESQVMSVCSECEV